MWWWHGGWGDWLARGEIDDDEYRRLDTLAESRAASARPKAGT
jgi:hypothetical protein